VEKANGWVGKLWGRKNCVNAAMRVAKESWCTYIVLILGENYAKRQREADGIREKEKEREKEKKGHVSTSE